MIKTFALLFLASPLFSQPYQGSASIQDIRVVQASSPTLSVIALITNPTNVAFTDRNNTFVATQTINATDSGGYGLNLSAGLSVGANILMVNGSTIVVPGVNISTSINGIPGLLFDSSGNAKVGYGLTGSNVGSGFIGGRIYNDDYTSVASSSCYTISEFSFSTMTVKANQVLPGQCIAIEFSDHTNGSVTTTRRLRIGDQTGLVAWLSATNTSTSINYGKSKFCRPINPTITNTALIDVGSYRESQTANLNVSCGSCTSRSFLAFDWTVDNNISYTAQLISLGNGTEDFNYMKAWIEK